MLIRYKRNYEKIAMGLLSFVPTEKDLKKLQQTMKEYEQNEHWQLYLWKQEEDIIGIVGISMLDKSLIEVQHVSVNPSHRQQGIGKKMIKALKEMYTTAQIKPSEIIAPFYEKCQADE
ncbi:MULTISPECIES: GNAT family N-acetyltransferase [Priestia]|jgi:riboflavin biosynthesis RibT protein|uniref:Acetyltransferase n=6 Tax=Priestia TaxID=2800373 RepID=D5DRL1_PRIM1|nr:MULTISPECIES: GNAT family N-acetyltransferase [Priestia]AVX10269.1 N-acetyltransferase [Bacillus sp. Y-01]KOP76358.1 acetyltransferase [Bacillus sp. FJAT-21351]KQU11113.1 acetyltransferase [Bacillus sp. Leaf75]KRD89523.1 acetyltransferase [Bacillus sp. Root147]KRF57661.1 acetyltransferase [Bacillus sp. Soil531]MBK0008039.1 GNAT family N-acetyltransferase [Bacillus sp. S35]MBK0293138.1 GNAT family N-acetyltransferase [Bacillus sp. S34]MBZ5478119.1 GNAT family N-acetyltransferase [Bacillus